MFNHLIDHQVRIYRVACEAQEKGDYSKILVLVKAGYLERSDVQTLPVICTYLLPELEKNMIKEQKSEESENSGGDAGVILNNPKDE